LAQLGTVCNTLVERIESDREERRELVQTITALASAVIGRDAAPAGHLVGGSVFGDGFGDPGAGLDDDDAAPTTIDLVAADIVADGDDPHARNGDAHDHDGGDHDVDVEAAAAPPAPGDEVRCRFGDRWVDGFEILEVHSREGRARCRVRRRSDGSVVRKLFEAIDLEVVSAPVSS
jgi:hypothetical protein